MINVSPAWPNMPPLMAEPDALLTEALGKVAILDRSDFTLRELQIGYLAFQDLSRIETGDLLGLSKDVIGTHRGTAFRKAGVPTIQGLVYAMYNSGWMPYERDDLGAQELKYIPPSEAFVLKGLALGETNSKIAERRGRGTNTMKSQAFHLGRKLGASTQPGMVGRGFELGLFVPAVQDVEAPPIPLTLGR